MQTSKFLFLDKKILILGNKIFAKAKKNTSNCSKCHYDGMRHIL